MSKTRFFGNLIKTNPTLPTANSGANYGTATGVWTLEEAGAFRAAGDWPIPASVPGAPTITGVTAGNAQVAVAFNANASTGGLDVTSFTALASSGQSASASSSPITVTGLTNGTAITFTVTATNAAGTSSASSASSSVTPVNPPRGLRAGGGTTKYNNSQVNNIDYITISSTGNATDFGDLSVTRTFLSGCSSTTRGVFHGGIAGGVRKDTIDYVTIASTGNASDFGDMGYARERTGSCSNNTRGILFGGDCDPSLSERTIEYITIASTGNATDFGDTTVDKEDGPAGAASSTRGVFFGGTYTPNNVIEYVTIASTGNATDFGDMNLNCATGGAFSSATRAVIGRIHTSGGSQNPINTIEYVTIASTGNATDFGDQIDDSAGAPGVSSSSRGVWMGGDHDGTIYNAMDYVTIASTGNATDFGDLTQSITRSGGCSSDHGGVQ